MLGLRRRKLLKFKIVVNLGDSASAVAQPCGIPKVYGGPVWQNWQSVAAEFPRLTTS